ncbi:nucleotidyltransferase domain-containing protein [Candidatus Peregrinibacteria bacterium]|nr:nucleotidyltransferase domain-containing protein [Candidatus Peregrinibacteria bacterium]
MFTDIQAQILALLVNNTDKEYSFSEIGAVLGKKPGIFQRGINSLEKQNIITSLKKGSLRLFKINKNCPILNEIKGIIQKTYGGETFLRKMVSDMKDIDIAFIYGSYAKNAMRPDSDIDLLVVAKPEAENFLLDKIAKLEQKLQREINYKLYSKKEFKDKIKAKDPFLSEILSDKYILLKGEI